MVQALVQFAAETAETVVVIAVAQCEHAVLESMQVQCRFAQLAREDPGGIRRLAVAIGGNDEQ